MTASDPSHPHSLHASSDSALPLSVQPAPTPAPSPVLVIGSRGMLASDLLPRLTLAQFRAIGLARPELDVTRPRHTIGILKAIVPAVVINCAAYTAVDRAESEAELAFAINRDGAAHLAEACMKLSVPLIHISTDYIFDGRTERTYIEDDSPNPLGTYGQSKWEGEEAIRARLQEHLIVRTSWLYGKHGQNFVKTILRLAHEKEELRVVSDQHGSPTWTGDLADALVTMVTRLLKDRNATVWGTYHFSGGGQTTWHGFAEAILEEARQRTPLKVKRLTPIPTVEYPTPARRPARSVLDCTKIRSVFGICTRPWRTSLGDMMKELYRETETA